MKKYYGLRLIRSFFLACSIVISIVTVASMGTFVATTVFGEIPFEPVRALSVLVIGGLLALFSYAFAQLIDLQLTNYFASARVLKEVNSLNEQNTLLLEALHEQLKLARLQGNLPKEVDLDAIQRQLDARRQKLS